MDPLASCAARTPKIAGHDEIGHCTDTWLTGRIASPQSQVWIDSCASGGNRNDLETLRRAVPLLRSDCFGDPTIQQCQNLWALALVPYFGSGTIKPTATGSAAHFSGGARGWDTRKTDLDYGLLKRMIAEFRKVQPYLLAISIR